MIDRSGLCTCCDCMRVLRMSVIVDLECAWCVGEENVLDASEKAAS